MSKQSLNPLQTRMLPPRSRMRLTPSSPMGSRSMVHPRALLRLSSPTDSSRYGGSPGQPQYGAPQGQPGQQGPSAGQQLGAAASQFGAAANSAFNQFQNAVVAEAGK